jgi:peroxiredoxin
MSWLKRKLRNWINNDHDKVIGLSARDFPDERSVQDDPVLSFRIYNAQNGKILEFSRYDRKTDRQERSVYIIEKDKDVTEYVGKCLSLELLR